MVPNLFLTCYLHFDNTNFWQCPLFLWSYDICYTDVALNLFHSFPVHREGLGLRLWRWCLSAASAGKTVNSARLTKTGSTARPKPDTREFIKVIPANLHSSWQVQFFTKALLCCFRWAKDKRVVLVSSHERKKWTIVRPLPTKKPVPAQFEVCQMFTRLQMASFALKTNFIVWLTTASLFPSLRFACTWQLGRSVSTSEIAHLHTAEKKEIFGLIWRNTTVSIQFCWTDLF